MGLATELGYHLEGHTERWNSFIRRLTSSRPMTALIRWTLRPLDTVTFKLTNGKSTVSEWLASLPPLWLTTTGARSGKLRTNPLFGIPIGDDLAVLGTAYGQATTPSWVYNLEANPDAIVSFDDREFPVRARPAAPAEATEIWAMAALIYPGYASYRERAPQRAIRVFVLEMRESV